MYEYFERLMNEFGKSQNEIARETGISQSTLSAWKTRNSQLNYRYLQMLADYFNVDVAYFFDGKRVHKDMDGNTVRDDLIDYETQILIRNDLLHKMLLAGGKVVDDNPEVIEAIIYTLQRLGEKK